MKIVLEAVEMPVPVRSPGATISLLSGSRVPKPLFVSLKSNIVAKPIPPKNLRGHSDGSVSALKELFDKSTLKILLAYPFIVFTSL